MPNTTVEEIYIVVLSGTNGGKRIRVQWVPENLSISPQANWTAIMPASRNLPIYHYGGGESTLVFDLDWLAAEGFDVMKNCEFIQSLCFTDGNNGPAPEVSIVWGESDMFRGHKYIVASAPYSPSRFRNYMGLRPLTATQKITLKRVSDTNPTYKDLTRDI